MKTESIQAADLSFYYNYENSTNTNIYWIDDLDYGSKIELIPANPIREGFTFGGWYKESECINPWDFEEDTLPQEMKNEDDEIVYQETRLYAKWI
ncbi:MAG: hypothetical protein EOM87_09060 [Clostridia bacterium]|nr:hypothetical protein [Clostridia bacterium]